MGVPVSWPGIERFLVEFVRTNPPALLGLTQQQWISIGLMVAGGIGVWWTQIHEKDAVGATPSGVAAATRGQRTPPKKIEPGDGRPGKAQPCSMNLE